jgi:hypothetical protein
VCLEYHDIGVNIFVYFLCLNSILGWRPNLQKIEVLLDNCVAHYFSMDLFGSHHRLIACPLSGVIPISEHLK